MYVYRNREEQLARYDRAIRLRMAGLSYVAERRAAVAVLASAKTKGRRV